jgi:hypothetical protein
MAGIGYNAAMVDVPQQDWMEYEARTAKTDAAWIRGLSVSERFALYDDLFSIVWGARRGPGDWERLDRWHWQQKLAARLQLVEMLSKLDQENRGRTVAENPGSRSELD